MAAYNSVRSAVCHCPVVALAFTTYSYTLLSPRISPWCCVSRRQLSRSAVKLALAHEGEISSDCNRSLTLPPLHTGHARPQHQIDGIQFMWKFLIQSVADADKGFEGLGVLMAHIMGLGKTLTVWCLPC